jgi:hypothetical protein
MQKVSSGFTPFSAVRDIGMLVRFYLIDPSAKKNGTVSASDSAPGTIAAETISENETISGKFAGLELNRWVLDGTINIPNDDFEGQQTGWWSGKASDENAELGSTLTFEFSAPVSTVGWSLLFDDKMQQYPAQITITAYGSDNAVIATATKAITQVRQNISLPAANYTKLTIRFDKTFLPKTRARLRQIDFGLTETYENDSMANVQIVEEASVSCDAFPSRQISFTFDNADHRYNILNPDGIFAVIQEGQKLLARCIINGESVDVGKFFFTSVTATNSGVTAQLVGNDMAAALERATYESGSAVACALQAAVASVLDGYDITVIYGGEAAERIVVPAIPRKTTRREAIRLLAQAAMCSVWFDRSGVLHIAPLPTDAVSGSITPDDLYNYDGVSISEAVDCVELHIKSDYANIDTTVTAGSGKNIKSVSNPCVAPANYQSVAAWLLTQYNRRKIYSVKNRCNPALETGDTIKISDAFGQNENAVQTGLSLTFDGSLYAITKGVGS